MGDINATEKQMSVRYSRDSAHPKLGSISHEETAHEAAAKGIAATDQYGQSLVQLDPAAERRLRRKMDFYVIPTVAMLYLVCFIDRANIGNANIAGLQKDLHMKGYDYNQLLSVFYVAYIVFEIPANMACKAFGPGWFIPAISLGFGICSLGTAFVHNLSQACVVRFFLGVFEAGMLPGIAYYLSRWYRRKELAWRLAGYCVMAPLAGAFGGLLASAILSLKHFGSLHTWRMLFAIEGIITIGLSIIAFFTMTDRPESAKWLTQEEKDLAIARIKSERVGQTAVLDGIDKKKFLRGVFNPATLGTAFMFLLDNVTVQGLAFFLPTIIKTIYPKATVVNQQLHTVPPYIVGAFLVLLTSWLSSRFDRRNVFMMSGAVLMMIGYIMFLASTKAMVRYGATFIIAGGAFVYGTLANAQVSANVVSDTARAAAIGTNVMLGNVGGLISTWAFLPFDAPNYHIGNGLNLATATTALIIGAGLMFWMKADNKKRELVDVDAKLAGLDLQQIEDLDWRHPAFRWRP